MNGDFRFNMAEIIKNIENAQVLCLYFIMLQKTLVVDYRFDDEEGPMIRLVPMVNSIEERYKSLRRMRPRFDRPESITIIPWPKRVNSLLEAGVWDRIVRRLIEVGSPELVNESEKILDQLLRAEKEEILAAIKGDRYHTLWHRSE